MREKTFWVNENVPCPYCNHLNDKHYDECEKCKNLLFGEDYLKTLVQQYSKILSLFNQFKSNPKLSSNDDINNLLNHLKYRKLTVTKLIKDSLAKDSFVVIDDEELRKVIKVIRDIDPSKNDPDWDDFIKEEDFEEMYNDLLGEIDPPSYYRRVRAIGTIVVGKSVPNILGEFIIEMKECYKFGLFNATIIFCRSLT